MSTRRMGRTLGLALIAAVLIPGRGVAQESDRVLIRDLPITERQRINIEAYVRESEASDLFRRGRRAERSGEWEEAAELYRRSAKNQSRAERLGAVVYELAGRAFHFSDQPERASRMWERAAGWALLFGDVLGSARNFLNAAVAAEEAGESRRAVEIAWKAHRLTESDLVSERERELIRRHLRVDDGGG